MLMQALPLARAALNAQPMRPMAPPRRVGSLTAQIEQCALLSAPSGSSKSGVRLRAVRTPRGVRMNTYRFKRDESSPLDPEDEDLHLKQVHDGKLSLDETQTESEPFIPMEELEALAAEEELKEADLQALSEVDLEAEVKEDEVTEGEKAVEEEEEGQEPVPPSQLEMLSEWSVIVADTALIESVKAFGITEDATTNPTLVLEATKLYPSYHHIMEQAVADAILSYPDDKEAALTDAADMVNCLFGRELTRIVPGYVSTEVDARLSYDTDASVAKARRLIELYEELGVERDRILIKLATTWDMLRAASQLESEGIHCNMTLVFNLTQAAAAADVGATLVSPFVGRISDWFKVEDGVENYSTIKGAPDEDPGVRTVREIYDHFRCNDVQTILMAASFRNVEQIKALAGVDRITISPKFLRELAVAKTPIERQLAPDDVRVCVPMGVPMDDEEFAVAMAADRHAHELLEAGIQSFSADQVSLEEKLKGMLATQYASIDDSDSNDDE